MPVVYVSHNTRQGASRASCCQPRANEENSRVSIYYDPMADESLAISWFIDSARITNRIGVHSTQS